MTPEEKITALLKDVAAVWDGYRSTHHEFCYRVHAGCLAHRIQPLMKEADEWEYAVKDYRHGHLVIGTTLMSPDELFRYYGERPLIRRRPAGQWEPVEAAENTP